MLLSLVQWGALTMGLENILFMSMKNLLQNRGKMSHWSKVAFDPNKASENSKQIF